MNLLHHLDTWFERYLALCAVVTLAWCFAVPRLKSRRGTRVEEPNFTVDDLLDDQPVDVWLTRELSDRMFAEHIAAEGLQ